MPSGRQSLARHLALSGGHATLQGRRKIRPGSSLDCQKRKRDPGHRGIPVAVARGRLKVLQRERDRPERAPVTARSTGAEIQAVPVEHALPDTEIDNDLGRSRVGACRVSTFSPGDTGACDCNQQQRCQRERHACPQCNTVHGAVPIHADSATRSSSGWSVSAVKSSTQRLHSSACSTSKTDPRASRHVPQDQAHASLPHRKRLAPGASTSAFAPEGG